MQKLNNSNNNRKLWNLKENRRRWRKLIWNQLEKGQGAEAVAGNPLMVRRKEMNRVMSKL